MIHVLKAGMKNFIRNTLFVLIFFVLAWFVFPSLYRYFIAPKPQALPRAVTPVPGELGAEEKSNIKIFQEMSPSVVSIKNALLRRDVFSLNVYEIPQGAGSGFLWDQDGHVVTNFHVVYQADKIDVILSGQGSFEARVIGVAPEYDLAVLKIDVSKDKLKALPLGESSKLKVGQKVVAIGNPFGLDHSMSTGIISALGRSIQGVSGRKIFDVIQTDAAINPGNSGGPLLDSFGRLVGVTTAIYSPSGAYAGIGFAIPVDTVNRVIPQLISQGRVNKVGIGVSLVPDSIRQSLGIKGATILKVMRGGAADQAGLRGTYRDPKGDIIFGDTVIEVDGKEIHNNDDLISQFEYKPEIGRKTHLKILRNSQVLEVELTLSEIYPE